ncbi:MAG: type I-F CRISPR-associated helicase Cas3f [Bacteroidales bacterium]
MMVTFVSQCEKRALTRTRRVLDAFADRIGDNTWQTVITQEGLQAVKKLLRKTASKNTAVSCHWIRSRSRSELVWVVGNRRKFDEKGIVPVNNTEHEVSQYSDKHQWKTLDIIKYAAAIAGLFHDFGKATILFQKKLNPAERTENFEPYRHEWISFRLFEAFVGQKTDIKWLETMTDIQKEMFTMCHFRDGLDENEQPKLSSLPPFAQLVAWLIVTHHKLPLYPGWKKTSSPNLSDIDEWMDGGFDALWNSFNCNDENQKERIDANWRLSALPVESMQWRSRACILASEAGVQLRACLNTETNWLQEHIFTTHLSRLALMLADHFYSSQKTVTQAWRNPHYKVFANSQWVDGKKQYKQQLDEHLIGVACHAENIVKSLPRLNATLLSLEPNQELTGNVSKELKEAYGWQDGARTLAEKIGKETIEKGFFGINMASTGKGKTRANAKIMAALGLQGGRVRFNVALGLRVLTLQTGREFQDELKLSDEELAIAVGGTAVKQLFENQQARRNPEKSSDETESPEEMGSESREELLDPDLYVHYKSAAEKHSLSEWTKQEKGLDALLQAPVLVSTIDHLMPATEGTKSGKQIPATLRLLTSDLVLDEPDDFGLEDLPALCRLVHWAGMLGSRVLLSTATIPPALAYSLFQAYQAGWSQYAKTNIEGWSGGIVCAWFDEWRCDYSQNKGLDDFKKAHEEFVEKRIKHLQDIPVKRWAGMFTVEQKEDRIIAESMADAIHAGAMRLHQDHCLNRQGKTLSIGLVRMANINPLVAVAKSLLKKDAPANSSIHYCVYHSRYPLAIRSSIESKLDRLLNRKTPDAIWQEPEIQQALQKFPDAQHHIFIVLASPVAEVGRDHDYDWAIVEPSSMRSIIQLAGRVLRHREQVPATPNILLLNKNYKALASKTVCFERPGFESKKLIMGSHDLFKVLDEEQYREITAIQRITLPASELYNPNADGKYQNLIGLEHKALHGRLFSKETGARLWWEKHPHWCGEVQRQQRFRDSKKDEAYFLWLDDEYSKPIWKWKNEEVSPPEFGKPLVSIKKVELDNFGAGIDFWFKQDALTVYQQLAGDFDFELGEVSRRFGEVRLTEYGNTVQEYNYHSSLGIYQDIGSET